MAYHAFVIDQTNLRALFSYSPETGIFTWRVSKAPRAKAGEPAGYENGSGYIKLSIGGVRYYAHRMAFLWMTGTIPKEIDHVNGCRSDNRWSNLRAANRSMNCSNVAGRRGVRLRYGRWYARFGHRHLGVFTTESEALNVRKAAEIEAAGVDPDKRGAAFSLIRPRRRSRPFLYQGKTLSEWSRITGIPQSTLHRRIHVLGVAPSLALTNRRTK